MLHCNRLSRHIPPGDTMLCGGGGVVGFMLGESGRAGVSESEQPGSAKLEYIGKNRDINGLADPGSDATPDP